MQNTGTNFRDEVDDRIRTDRDDGGTPKIEISNGSNTTPPPIPVNPINSPAIRPMLALVAIV
jgi:hypothetical protein